MHAVYYRICDMIFDCYCWFLTFTMLIVFWCALLYDYIYQKRWCFHSVWNFYLGWLPLQFSCLFYAMPLWCFMIRCDVLLLQLSFNSYYYYYFKFLHQNSMAFRPRGSRLFLKYSETSLSRHYLCWHILWQEARLVAQYGQQTKMRPRTNNTFKAVSVKSWNFLAVQF